MGDWSWTPGRHDEPAGCGEVVGPGQTRVAVMKDPEPVAAKPRSRTRLVVQVVVSLVLVVGIFYFLLRGIDLAEVWAEIRAMTWIEDAILAAIAA
jgi:hypothetical protein